MFHEKAQQKIMNFFMWQVVSFNIREIVDGNKLIIDTRNKFLHLRQKTHQ